MDGNMMDNSNYSKDTMEVVEPGPRKTSTIDGDAEPLNTVAAEFERKLKFFEHKVKELENELAYAKANAELNAKDKLEHIGWYEEQLRQALKERDSALKSQESLEIFEMESKWLKSELGDSQSKISQLELNLRQATNDKDEMAMTVQILQERESLLKDQLAAAELKAKLVEEELICQTELLEKEIERREQAEKQLEDTKTMLNKCEMDKSILSEKLQQLEDELKDYDEDDDSDENEESYGRSVDSVDTDVENLSEQRSISALPITETKEMSDITFSSDSALQYSNIDGANELLVKNNQPTFLKDATSQNTSSFFEQQQRNGDASVEAETQITATQLALENSRARERKLLSKLNAYEDRLTVQEGVIKQLTTKCSELEDFVDLQGRDTDTKCAEAKSAFMHAVSEAKKLEEKLMLFERLVKEAEEQVAKESAASQASKGGRLRSFARSLSMPMRQVPRRPKKPKDQNSTKLGLGCAETIDEVIISPGPQMQFNFNMRIVTAIAIVSLIVGLVVGRH